MNLEKLLAANMIRFGVKNLNEQLRKTLLNEGVVAGGEVEAAPVLEFGYTGAAKNLIDKILQPYTSDPTLKAAAITALATSCKNIASTDKTLRKASIKTTADTILMLAGNGLPSGVDVPKADQIIAGANFEYTRTEVAVYPAIGAGDPKVFPKPNYSSAGDTLVATVGKINNDNKFGPVKNTGTQTWTTYGFLVNYLNRFNLTNTTTNDYTQYRLDTMLDTNNFVNYLKTEVATNSVIVYTETTKVPDLAGKNVGTTTQGATAPIDKVYDVNFAQSVATVPPNDAEVARAIKDAIAMFPDGNISNLSVVSSASPEYGAIKNVTGWEKSYPKGVTGTGNPGNGTDDASKNIKLAYDRGVNFVAAINAGLAAQGKPEMVNTSINWQISDTGGSPTSLGRFANVLWSKAGTPATETSKVANTGEKGAQKAGGDTFTIYQHVFTVS